MSTSQFLLPVHDDKNQMIDIIDLSSDEIETATKIHNFVGIQIIGKNVDKPNDHDAKGLKHTQLFITDSIFNAFTLLQATNCPAIVVNSNDWSLEVVNNSEKPTWDVFLFYFIVICFFISTLNWWKNIIKSYSGSKISNWRAI